MTRTTTKQLESLLRQLAAVTNAPISEPYVKDAIGRFRAVIGALTIDGNIGGYRVEQISNENGGVCTPLGDCRFTKGELYECLRYALGAVRMALGDDEFHRRMRRAYSDSKTAKSEGMSTDCQHTCDQHI